MKRIRGSCSVRITPHHGIKKFNLQKPLLSTISVHSSSVFNINIHNCIFKATYVKGKQTPMMNQYFKMKEKYPGYLVMFRIGDFYEIFYDDALKAAPLLNIALTSRSKSGDGPEIPMCGIPVTQLDNYLHKLIKNNIMVAVCDQLEDANEAKQNKRIIQRDITRLVTPGTVIEEGYLNPRKHHYLASIVRKGKEFAISWIDLSTGEFQVAASTSSNLAADVSRLSPSEVLVDEELKNDPQVGKLLKDYFVSVQPLDDLNTSESRLKRFYEIDDITSIGIFEPIEIIAGNAVLKYIETTQIGNRPHLSAPIRYSADSTMTIDANARRALELTDTMSGEKKRSLLSIIDRTITGAGARMLLSYLNTPLTSVEIISQRLDIVEFFNNNEETSDNVRGILRQCYDIQRSLQRLYLGKGSPRDLAEIGATLSHAHELQQLLFSSKKLPPLLQTYAQFLTINFELVDLLARALVESPPQSISDGGFIMNSFSPELDSLRGLRDDTEGVISNLQAKYRQDTGVTSLKVKRNNIAGFHVEIPPTHKAKMPSNFHVYQTGPSIVRYKTSELSELEAKANNAAAEAIKLEQKIFDELVEKVLASGHAISDTAVAIAAIDVGSALGVLAREYNYVRPIVNDSLKFEIKKGRHPTVEALQRERGVYFVPNDCSLSEERFWLITGPNMGGKSTYLRQNAIIAIMAQMGSFVPAEQAEIGLVDAIYSRVGSGDDLTRDKSTFMVEMLETAEILHKATKRSLVIMDEVGRGTSTHDGISIAVAVSEHLYEKNQSRVLFATHYHELMQMKERLVKVALKALGVEQRDGELIFTYKLVEGSAHRSFGIHVAQLAGLPQEVLKRAHAVLEELSSTSSQQDPAISGILEQIKKVDTKKLTSVEAIRLITKLRLILLNSDEVTPKSKIK